MVSPSPPYQEGQKFSPGGNTRPRSAPRQLQGDQPPTSRSPAVCSPSRSSPPWRVLFLGLVTARPTHCSGTAVDVSLCSQHPAGSLVAGSPECVSGARVINLLLVFLSSLVWFTEPWLGDLDGRAEKVASSPVASRPRCPQGPTPPHKEGSKPFHNVLGPFTPSGTVDRVHGGGSPPTSATESCGKTLGAPSHRPRLSPCDPRVQLHCCGGLVSARQWNLP